MADFGGWEMPIEYPAGDGGGVIAEHSAVRERIGLFDVSHLGKARVRGVGATAFVNSCITNDLSRIGDGQAQYTMLCDDASGGVIDDLIVYRISDDELFLVPNAANTAEVVARLKANVPQGVEVVDEHEKFAVFALQGPLTFELLKSIGIEIDLNYMSFTRAEIADREVILCRTGYTGEQGVEIIPRWHDALVVWKTLVSEVEKCGGRISGLGARDTLRTEMCYPLHGHELSLTISPLEAGATWAVGWKKESFWGSRVLRAQKESGNHRRLIAFTMRDRGIPRAEMKVVDVNGAEIGVVTSGTFSPTLKNGIGLALVSKSISVGEEICIDIRGKMCSAEIKPAPLVPSHVR